MCGVLIGVLLAALLSWSRPCAATIEPPQVTLPLLKHAPVLDGNIEESEWAEAVRNVGLISQHDLKLGDREAIFWVGCDGQTLYIAMKSELPPGGSLLTRAVPDGDRDIAAALYDDSVELVLHPHWGVTSGDRRYFHLIVNARGAQWDRSLDEANPANPVSMAWRLKEWQFCSGLHEGWWHVEIGIPLRALGASAEDLRHPWGLRIGRNWQRPWDQSRWESVSAAYEDVPTMPRVCFGEEHAPVVQVLRLRGDKQPQIELAVANPGSSPLPVRVFLSDAWSRNPPTEMIKELSLAGGTRAVLTFQPPHGGPAGDHHTILRVTSPDGQQVFYYREFVWRFERSPQRWAVVQEDQPAVKLQYKVYPYYRKLKVRVDTGALAAREQVTGAEVTFGKLGAQPALRGRLTFHNFVAEALFDTPELTGGTRQVQVRLRGGEGVPHEPVVGLYERRLFPWEHNRLGMSARVIPPFTPIVVRGKVLSTVLRSHYLEGTGLWGQVVSLGKPLLRGPMRWVVRVGGQERPVQPGRLRLVSAAPHRVVTEGGFLAGPLHAVVQSEWDYDGMAKITLTLTGPQSPPLDRLSAEIPLDDAQVPYMHACGDGLRYNYAGKTPTGQGTVWDSSRANKSDLVGTFYPYLWLGGGERGLAWFADSDRGFSLDDTTPVLQLERRGAVLLLRINFVTKPTSLAVPRQIVFGLQATPVKPMPEAPVSWRRWLCHDYQDLRVQPFRILGSTFYYGCLGFDFYPRDHDLSIYQALAQARRSGVYDAEFVARWLEGYRRHGVQPGSEQWTFFKNHIEYAMREAAGSPRPRWLWTAYTNPRGIGYHLAEWPSFQDEWVNFPYHPRAKVGGLSYEICPVRSFQDAALWYYRDMMTCFDGIYWDNIFLAANFDTVAGGAWVDEQGRLHPSMGLWAMRELIKRTAVMFHEMGRPLFLNVAHMTNTNIVPLLSFANCSLDWEWQYGKRDFQDRFPADLIVAETIGRQCGNIPLILAGGFYDPNDPAYAWVMRTRLGVCLVHELRVWDWGPEFHYAFYRKLFEFGYGEQDCRVFNYWDEDFPLLVSGCEAKGIVMVKGRRALVIVTDYGEGGQCRLALALDKLGLPSTLRAIDFESGEPLASPAPGVAIFPLKQHDFKAVLFE
jgi:hypothetical protein